MQQPQADGETIAIVLSDDHKVVRSGLRMLLQAEDDLTVVAEAGDATPPSATSAAIVYVLKQSAGDELVGAVRHAHIQQQTGRSTRAELVRYALDYDLVE